MARKSLRERLDDPVWILEQLAHFAAGLCIAMLSAWLLAFWTTDLVAGSVGMGLGAGAAGARETLQNWGDSDNDYLDLAIDVLAWVAGAVLGGLSWVL